MFRATMAGCGDDRWTVSVYDSAGELLERWDADSGAVEGTLADHGWYRMEPWETTETGRKTEVAIKYPF